jgi:hypothetical protein
MSDERSVAGEVARLYALDIGSFVAERTALTKEWKKGRRRDDAAVIAALRKPSVVEHAVNAAARSRPLVVRRWAAAIRRADSAQSAAIGGADATDLRSAMADVRAATSELVDAAVTAGGDETKRADIISLIRRLAAGSTALVVAGVIGSAAAPVEELFAGAPDPPERTAVPSAQSKPSRHHPASTASTSIVTPAEAEAEGGTATSTTATSKVAAERAREERRVQARRAAAEREVEDARSEMARAEEQRERAAKGLDRAVAVLAKLTTTNDEPNEKTYKTEEEEEEGR